SLLTVDGEYPCIMLSRTDILNISQTQGPIYIEYLREIQYMRLFLWGREIMWQGFRRTPHWRTPMRIYGIRLSIGRMLWLILAIQVSEMTICSVIQSVISHTA